MNTLHVTCGLPGAGKSTLSKNLSETCDLKLYCYDKLKRTFDRDTIIKNIEKDLKEFDVIFDDLFICKYSRLHLLENINIPCKKVLIVLETPLEECLKRNRQRNSEERLSDNFICDLHKRYQPPSLDEGWDDIQFIK